MANALPIVSLDMSFSSVLKEREAGIFIDPGMKRTEIIGGFAQTLTQLQCEPALRRRLGMNGYRFVNEELDWDKKIECVYGAFLHDTGAASIQDEELE